jgi:transposase-like protein
MNEIRCLKCNSKDVVRKGIRKCKFGEVQKFTCKKCGANFTDKKLENTTYSGRVIMSALNNYNLGLTLEESSKNINKRFKVRTSKQILSLWLKKFEDICSFMRLRKGELKNSLDLVNDRDEGVLLKKEFFHKQPYTLFYHKIKGEKFLNKYFSGLRDYIFNVVEKCPDKLFNEENLRCSQLEKFEKEEVDIKHKENYACNVADFALKAINDNYERHEFVENLLLINDTATFAVEVPLWLEPREVPAELSETGIFCITKPLTGHIDILQARFGVIHILDFKPDAKKINAIAQLFAYALALSVRTGIWLRNFRCAWFDNKDYFEFSPGEIVLSKFEEKGVLNELEWNTIRKYNLDERARRYYTSQGFQIKRALGLERVNLEKGGSGK